MPYVAALNRYATMRYSRCGRSGLKLPAVSLGLWHNFGGDDVYENGRAMARRAFDLGITHFDLANNYGPPSGSAEESFGRILAQRPAAVPRRTGHLDEGRAGDMWPGPYGEWGSRKYLLASLDQSLQRMGLEYVDIFYHHRPDPDTPLEETMGALDHIVRQGKALYAGISAYPPNRPRRAAQILRTLGTPCLIHQPAYSMFNRWVEDGLLEVLEAEGMGCIVFSPAGAGPAHGQIPAAASPMVRGRAKGKVPEARGHHRSAAQPHPPAERTGRAARADAGADGRWRGCSGMPA